MIDMREYTDEFQPEDLVNWHESYENKYIPVPGVVIRQESDGVIIKGLCRVYFESSDAASRELVSR